METKIEKKEEMNWKERMVLATMFAVWLVVLMGIAGWAHNL